MSDKPAVLPNGFCSNKTPVPGTARQVNAHSLGAKFSRMHGRRYADCPCGKSPALTERGKLRPHKQPTA
ncbi:hypothetical protein [Streptomyces sp. N35]|uniref:hypothetical protein n=1 Tax=Streptomyces sp. N35 TaxID=2795730 RepID=UPI0018F5AEAC|nr:hypothetical protein [Streptomyces sp. N35]